MYAWIWHHLPGGLRGKLIISLVLVAGVAALFWYVIFPWAEPLLPFDDVQVGTEGAENAESAGGDVVEAPDGTEVETTSGEHAIPYSTETNNPPPSGRGR